MNGTPSPASGMPQPGRQRPEGGQQELAVRPAGHRVRTPTVVAALALSWLGLLAHNLAELTGQARLGPATLVPTVVWLLLAAGWLSPARRVAAWLLLGWGWLHAIGGGLLSVLPVPLWPYRPAQSLRHYAVHALYTALQVPLLIVMTRYLVEVAFETGSTPPGPARGRRRPGRRGWPGRRPSGRTRGRRAS
jgi:hypothetical protein